VNRLTNAPGAAGVLGHRFTNAPSAAGALCNPFSIAQVCREELPNRLSRCLSDSGCTGDRRANAICAAGRWSGRFTKTSSGLGGSGKRLANVFRRVGAIRNRFASVRMTTGGPSYLFTKAAAEAGTQCNRSQAPRHDSRPGRKNHKLPANVAGCGEPLLRALPSRFRCRSKSRRVRRRRQGHSNPRDSDYDSPSAGAWTLASLEKGRWDELERRLAPRTLRRSRAPNRIGARHRRDLPRSRGSGLG
jgi:hypothetical protein